MMLLSKLFPFLRRQGQQLQGVGIGQIPKRLGFCVSEQGDLLGPVLLEDPHEVLGG